MDSLQRAQTLDETSLGQADDQDNTAARTLDAVPAACAVFRDDDGLLLHANAIFARTFGQPTGALTRSDFMDRFQHFAATDESSKSQPARRAADQVHDSEVYEANSKQWFLLQYMPLRWTDNAASTLLTATNISEDRAALRSRMSQQEQLLFTSRMMSVGEMATTMAHELNQPLAAIINYLSVGLRLLEVTPGQAQVAEAITMARSQAEHASDIISHVREFVRSREPQRDNNSINSIVAKVTQLIELVAQENRVLLELQIDDGLPEVRVDRVMIEQVMLNLIKNAIDAMRETPPAQRKVTVSSRLTLDGEVEVRVTDCGCGMTQADEQQLFDPFFTTKPDGLGVGLAICRSIMEYHEGRLYFERDPDGSTVFAITLPPA